MANGVYGGADRRSAFRRTCVLGGSLRFATRTQTFDARIRNLSQSGARMQIANPYWLPDRFELEIAHHDIRVPVKVIWRNAEELGVIFLPNQRGLMSAPRQNANIIDLQAAREKLRLRAQLPSEF